MNEIKLILDNCGQDGFVSPEDLKALYEAVVLLVDKVEELEEKIKNLSS